MGNESGVRMIGEPLEAVLRNEDGKMLKVGCGIVLIRSQQPQQLSIPTAGVVTMFAQNRCDYAAICYVKEFMNNY